MKIHQTPITGVLLLELTPYVDARGAFTRLYCEHELAEVIGSRKIVQINQSRSSAIGTIRGMHYQTPPFAETKFVRCLKGRIWDVAVDLRANSPTFLKWHAEELSPENKRMLVIPEGCAHGFQVLAADSELLYLHTNFYSPQAEGGVHYAEPQVNITWPLSASELSPRDASYPRLNAHFQGLFL